MYEWGNLFILNENLLQRCFTCFKKQNFKTIFFNQKRN